MKHPVFAILLTVTFISPSTGASVDVFFMSGQSNMSGRLTTGYVADPRDSQVSYYYRTDGPPGAVVTSGGVFTTLQPLPSGYYGAEIQVGRNLFDLGLNPAIIKVSRGSTGMLKQWNSRTDGEWWNNWKSDSLDALSDLTAAGHTVNIRGFFWLQGETDANNPVSADAYGTNFSNFVVDVTAHLSGAGYNTGDLRFVTALIIDQRTYAPAVRSGQKAAMDAIANGDWFDTDDLTLFDGTHYDAASVATVGDRFVSTYTAIPEPSAALLALCASGIFLVRKLQLRSVRTTLPTTKTCVSSSCTNRSTCRRTSRPKCSKTALESC